MSKTAIDAQIRARIEEFTADLTELIHESALASIQEALGGSAAPRPVAAPRKAPAKRAKATRAAKSSGKRVRRSSADLAKIQSAFVAHVRANPGQRIEEITGALGLSSKDLRRPVSLLIEDGKVRTEGQRRGTRYFVGGGARKAAPAKRKKSAAKKTRSKKAGAKKKAARR